MDGTELNTLPLSSYGDKTVNCVCGKTHTIKTQDILHGVGAESGLEHVIGKFIPSGSAILIISDEYGRQFRTDTERSIARFGYRLTSYIIESGDCCPKETANKIPSDEDVRLIIGAGGGDAANTAKILSTEKKLPLLLLANSPAFSMYLAPFVFWGKDIPKIYNCSPPAALIADSSKLQLPCDNEIAAGFGEIVSKLIALFDWQASSLIEGEPYCPFISEQAMALIDSVLEKLERNYYNMHETAALILEHNIRFSALLQLSGDYSLTGGGESQASSCLDLLLRSEQRESKLSGENRFIIASVLSKVYINALKQLSDIGFVPPPDNNIRAETAERYLGVPEQSLLNKLKHYSVETLRLEDFKLREFRTELLDLIIQYDKKLIRGMKIFRRLYRDCGYSLLNYLDRTDLSLCIGLGPDLRETFTLLTQMKNMGLLDRYI